MGRLSQYLEGPRCSHGEQSGNNFRWRCRSSRRKVRSRRARLASPHSELTLIDVAEPESPLELASEIYAPFDEAETRRLRHFVADVEGLANSALFSNPTNTVTISAGMNEPLKERLEFAGEEAVHAVVGRFRQLYNGHQPSSYNHILKLLGRHVHERESPHQREALDALKELRKWEGEARRSTSGLQIKVNEDVLSGPVLIDLFVHGHYLHKGNAKSDQLEAFPLRGMLLSEFIRAMTVLMHVYWVGRNVVARVLETPSLLPGSPVPVG
jgi:hypothetical protein